MITKETAEKRAKISRRIQDAMFRRLAICEVSWSIWIGSLLGNSEIEVIFGNYFWAMLTKESKEIIFAKIEQKGFYTQILNCVWKAKVKIYLELMNEREYRS